VVKRRYRLYGRPTGGEEFAWLLPGVTLAESMAEAETLRLKIRDAGICHTAAAHGVTASLGVSAGIGMTPQALVGSVRVDAFQRCSG
jgi:PleD family two-component response regulator